MNKKAALFDIICEPLFALEGIEKSTSYGTPAIKYKGKLLIRLREDNVSIAIKVDIEDRNGMINDHPELFFVTEHYLTSPFILARVTVIHPNELFNLVKHQWKKLQKTKKKDG